MKKLLLTWLISHTVSELYSNDNYEKIIVDLADISYG